MMTKDNVVLLSVTVTKKKWSTVWFVYYTNHNKREVARFLGRGDAYNWVKEKQESIESQVLPFVKEIIVEYGKT